MTKQQPTILIVEDEPVIRSILTRIAFREGFKTDEASNGYEALRKMKTDPYDIVISDIVMPEMNGIELLYHIRTEFPGTRVLMITGFAGDYTSEQALREGADSYIRKPFRSNEIAAALHQMADRGQKSSRPTDHGPH